MSLYNRLWRDQQRSLDLREVKTGGAYTGWRPKPGLPSWVFDLGLVALALALVFLTCKAMNL